MSETTTRYISPGSGLALTRDEKKALITLWDDFGQSSYGLADSIDVSLETAQDVIGTLMHRGFITQCLDGEGNAMDYVELTDSGRSITLRLRADQRQRARVTKVLGVVVLAIVYYLALRGFATMMGKTIVDELTRTFVVVKA